MIFKYRSVKPIRKGLKFFLAAELVILTSTYLAYTSCNRSQATRKFFHDSPGLKFIVEFYYRIGEAYGTESVRLYDQLTWDAQAKEQEKGQ